MELEVNSSTIATAKTRNRKRNRRPLAFGAPGRANENVWVLPSR